MLVHEAGSIRTRLHCGCLMQLTAITLRIYVGGHIVHVASTLGQLEGIPLDGVKAYITSAKSVQELIDMPYPAEELAKVGA